MQPFHQGDTKKENREGKSFGEALPLGASSESGQNSPKTNRFGENEVEKPIKRVGQSRQHMGFDVRQIRTL